MYAAREFVEDGGLMSYGASLPDLFRRAATYVDKILKEANPADLPVEQPTKLELVFNLKTAKDLGLVIPREFLSNERRDVCSGVLSLRHFSGWFSLSPGGWVPNKLARRRMVSAARCCSTGSGRLDLDLLISGPRVNLFSSP